MSLFGIKSFSEAGTTELRKEQATYMMFRDLLEELDGKGWHFTCIASLYRCCTYPIDPRVVMDVSRESESGKATCSLSSTMPTDGI